MERVFEENKKFLDKRIAEKKWNMFVEAVFAIGNPDRRSNKSGRLPISSLEGEALREYMLLHDNEGELDWSDFDENEVDFEL